MAREAKPGISFFQMDCDNVTHKKIKLLFNELGADGYWIWSCIISEGYKHDGYFFPFGNKDDLTLFADDICKKDATLVEKVIECCIYRRLFDKDIAIQYQVLTCERMQEVYLYATKERRRKGTRVFMAKEYLLVDPGTEKNVTIVKLDDPMLPVASAHQNKPAKAPAAKPPKEVVPPTPAEDAVKELRKLYDGIEKTKKHIHDFIVTNKPQFIDPYLQLWNIWAVENGKPTVKASSDLRKRHMTARLKEKEFDFIQILAIAKKSRVILEGDWFSFDWFTKSQTNYLKVLEGNYNNNSEENNGQRNEAEAALERKLTGKA